jgi:hypothetical protein
MSVFNLASLGYFDTFSEFLDDVLEHPTVSKDWPQPWFDKVGQNNNNYIFLKDASVASNALAQFWTPLFILIALYVCFVLFGQQIMSTKERIYNKNVLFVWNSFLSIFSICGFCAVLPVALFHPQAGMFTAGLKATVCSDPAWYGHGICGLFVLAFILSKLFELLDTAFLVLGKRPVIFLHWYHHVTVLLFCWHSYTQIISTGVWFAVVNYGVHSVMYTYYACTQHSKVMKCWVAPIAPYITLIQTSQMLFGLGIIGSNIYYHSVDPVGCRSRKGNNLLGLLMYFSYFLLFAKLGIERFCCKKKKSKKKSA